MAADKDFANVRAHQLENGANYLVWRRHFERTGKDLDVWDILSGNEKAIKDEPTEEYHIVYVGAGPVTRASEIDGPRTGLKLQAAYKRRERKRKVEHTEKISSWSTTKASSSELRKY